jgi:predicted ATPase
MPGRRLNNTERHLEQRWDDGNGYNTPRLSSIEISGNGGLRGLHGVVVPFRYPLTAICGSNGAGKTTILSLAALAFHSPAAWFVHWGVGRGRRNSGDRTHYKFSDFFQTSPDDEVITDVSVTWRYLSPQGEITKTMRKSANGWGRYDRRPQRHVDFLPLARVLPAIEMAKQTNMFRQPATPPQVIPIEPAFRAHLNYIMGRNYASAEILRQNDMLFARCNAGAPYSAFNMGAGEAAVIGLLYLLQRLPMEGLLVVEEIEAGLHPQAHERLASVLLSVCEQKRLQIICSSHSESFLDAIPRQARLLIHRVGGGLDVSERPSARYCLARMIGAALDEIVVYCEDGVAVELVRAALPSSVVSRTRIVPIGDGSTLVQQGVSHVRGGNPGRVLCVFDGDTTNQKIQSWMHSHNPDNTWNVPHLVLPGGMSPERWIMNMLQNPAYEAALATQLRCQQDEARMHIQAVAAIPDPHDIWHEFERRTGIPREDCVRLIVRAVADGNPGLEQLRERVAQLLA